MYSFPSTSTSVAPRPNLLYSTVSPGFVVNSLTLPPTRPSPTASTSPVPSESSFSVPWHCIDKAVVVYMTTLWA